MTTPAAVDPRPAGRERVQFTSGFHRITANHDGIYATKPMASRIKLVELLTPLGEILAPATEGRSGHDPLALVEDRLARLLRHLRDPDIAIQKMQVLNELAFLSEHSLDATMQEFHAAVQRAIDEAVTPGWS